MILYLFKNIQTKNWCLLEFVGEELVGFCCYLLGKSWFEFVGICWGRVVWSLQVFVGVYYGRVGWSLLVFVGVCW